MKCLAFIFCLLLVVCENYAQESFIIKQGESVGEALSAKDIYGYPSFVNGVVFFLDGTQTAAKLNYNLLVAEVQFIDTKGDTVSIANEETIRYITIATDSFYFSNGFVRLIRKHGNVALAERPYYKQFIQKPGSYGLSTATTATNNVSMLLDKRSVNLNTDQEMILKRHTDYFIANKNNRFTALDKRNLARVFPNFKKEISNYLNQNSIDYNKKDDVAMLFSFLQGLTQ